MTDTPIIDTHCHLDFDEFDNDRDTVIDTAKKNNISDIIIPATQKINWEKIKKICEADTALHACYGFHPYWADTPTNKDLDALESWVNHHPCVGIGECGLDYRKGQVDKNRQLQLFEAQLQIAANNHLPIVIHSINATEDILRLLKKYPGVTGKMHSYSGSQQQAEGLVDLDFFISFGGTITYDNATKHRATAQSIPLNKLMIESNAPDQPDSEHQHQRNQPAYLSTILSTLAQLRTEDIEEIATQTTLNAKLLFSI